MNRIEQKFKGLKRTKKKALIAFITAGDPSLRTTEELVLAFEKSGVDIVELGVPFSDPLADGPTIQASSQRAIKKGTNLTKVLNMVKRIRRRSEIPIALMTYFNPVFHYGEDKFIREAKRSGVDGVIIPDLPPEEGKALIRSARAGNISTVFFISPTTTRKRMRRIVKASTGFIYYVSLTGVTGAKKGFSKNNTANLRLARQMTKLPVCIGFGVATPSQAKAVSKHADGVIVGSAIVKRIEKNRGKKNLVKSVSQFVHTLARSLK